MYLIKPNHLIDNWFNHDYTEDSKLWRPNLDIEESDKAYKILADLPGLCKEDLKLSVEKNILTLSGERKSEEEKEENGSLYRERCYGKFERSFALPENTDTEKIKADLNNGVLSLTIPKGEKAKAKKIEIK
jgi:HSP20 family protein